MRCSRATALAPPAEGVFWYELDDPVHGTVPQLARQDSERVATWIAERVRRGGAQRPGEFLLLTPNTKWLARYAAALEARNVPVQVTGARRRRAGQHRAGRAAAAAACAADPGDRR
jgi:superfamily I DNA/RNA helicase